MGILDSIKDLAVNTVKEQITTGAGGGYIKVVESLLSEKGGIGGLVGLVSLFNKADLGNVISSWISKSTNLPISGEQLKNVFGSDLIKSLTKQAGVEENTLVSSLTKLLPSVIDQLTPDGKVPSKVDTSKLDITSLVGSLLKK